MSFLSVPGWTRKMNIPQKQITKGTPKIIFQSKSSQWITGPLQGDKFTVLKIKQIKKYILLEKHLKQY